MLISALSAECEKLIDVKREKQFELEMLDDQNARIAKREELRRDQLSHKVDVLRLNQDKLAEESKSCVK